MNGKRLTVAACIAAGVVFTGLAAGFTSLRVTPVEHVASLEQGNFRLDTVHSSAVFSVKHMGVANFYGRFNRMEATINWHPNNPANSSLVIRVDPAGIDTGNERRDAHLRNPDFFNVPEFPHVTFTSSKIERSGDAYKVHGELEMLGVKRPLTVDLRQVGSTQHRSGRELIGLESKFTIKRSEWNMNYGIEAGALSDEVNMIFSLEALAAE